MTSRHAFRSQKGPNTDFHGATALSTVLEDRTGGDRGEEEGERERGGKEKGEEREGKKLGLKLYIYVYYIYLSYSC